MNFTPFIFDFMIPEQLKNDILQSINTFSHEAEKYVDFRATGGGCINHTGRYLTNKQSYFVKWNNESHFPGMFQAEMQGLKALQTAQELRVPEPHCTGLSGEYSFLLMEWIESGPHSEHYWEDLGIQLANLHNHTNSDYGWESSNYIGSLVQENNFQNNWIDFFIRFRLEKQLKLAINSGKLDSKHAKYFQVLFKKLPELLPTEPPSLIHGDLWSGNVMVGEHGSPLVVDPAVYFGNREIELSFTHLFGGFSQRFYETYQLHFPMQPGFDNRIQIYNLYPLLVHTNLFGGGYIRQVESIISNFR